MFGKFLICIAALIAAANCDQRVKFRFYTSAIEVTEYNVDTFPSILSHSNFQRNRQTVILHYSNGQNLLTPQVHDVITAYATAQNFNFIVVAYDSDDIVTTGNAVSLAGGISTALVNICEFGYNSALLSLIGNGLGAQILARASRNVQNNSNRRHIVGRLTGLDPGSLGTIAGIQIGRLSPADAQWVETIHTDPTLGDHDSRGHIHFLVNGGNNQPMCTQGLPGARSRCNHDIVMNYWAESVRAVQPIFPSLYCDAWSNFVAGNCNNNLISHMGRSNSATTLRGSYFLRTNDRAPFTRTQAQP